jgi:hypothetical protein
VFRLFSVPFVKVFFRTPRRYNQALRDDNTSIGSFPDNLLASLSGFQRREHYFQAAALAHQVPKEKFPGPRR